MIKKCVQWGLGLIFVAALSFPAFADNSTGYQKYYQEGVKAFQAHDDQKALRCFSIAQIYDPVDKDLNQYLTLLKQRGVVLMMNPSRFPPEQTIGFKYYFSGAVAAFQRHYDKKAIRYFKIALIFNPDSKDSLKYLRILYLRHGLQYLTPNLPPEPITPPYIPPVQVPTAPAVPVVTVSPQTASTTTSAQGVSNAQASSATVNSPAQAPGSTASQPFASAAPPVSPKGLQAQTSIPSAPSPAAIAPILIGEQKPKAPPMVLSLQQLIVHGGTKGRLQIVLHSSVIIEDKNIQRFLVVDENFIGAKILDADHLKVDAVRIGSTFLHIWDAMGRYTIYVEVVFPSYIMSAERLREMNGIEHAQPFRFVYTNDWNTNYSGKNIPDLKRQSYEFTQSLSMTGETPYGFLDSSAVYSDFNTVSQFDYYTVGLSQIPLEGTTNFNLRGFDASRYLSILTMPTTPLRGVFADVDLFDDILGLSFSHGQLRQTTGFISVGQSLSDKSYIDAAKITLFPLSERDRYSFNFATAYGPDRQRYLSSHVYSLEGQHMFNDNLMLKAEEGSDSSHDASLASLKWRDQGFSTALNFRNIDKNYATVSSLPAYQGETGATWTTDYDSPGLTANSFIEAYRDRLNSSHNKSGALDYDAYGQVTKNISTDFSSDTDFNFVDTQADVSPQRSVGLHERLSRNFGIWNSLKGTVFGGAGYQNNNSPNSRISDFDREDVIAGVQLPLTVSLFSFANYEYDWLNQPGEHSTPSVINAGFGYEKSLNPRLSVNSEITYRDELGVKATNNSFLSGERSVIVTAGLAYNPIPDVTLFADANATKVISHTGGESYDDFEAHLGVRIIFGGEMYWDPLGTVSGIVYKDMNGNGRFSAGDEGIEGVKVKVGGKEALTDKFGRYSIKVRAKGVDVMPVLDTVPGGLLFSTPQVLKVHIIQGRIVHADFGLISQTGIYGIVFIDKKGNGVPNEGDIFIGKVKVILDGKITQKSDFHGAFYFRKVPPGKHTIAIDINTIALNMVPLVKLKNEIDVPEGTNYMFNIPLQIKAQAGDQE